MLSISVVTPSLNQCAYIRSTVDSVLMQEYPEVEYLIMDGKSTDGTLDVLQSYGDRLRWFSEPDAGQSAAINRGWQESTGDILAWLNADDVYLQGTLRRVAAYFDVHPDVEAVYGDCGIIDTAGNTVGQYPVQEYDYHELLLKAVNYIPQPAMFVRRNVLETLNGLNEELHYAMDFDLWLRMANKMRVAYLPEKLANIRIHTQAKSIKSLGKFGSEIVGIYEQLFKPGILGSELQSIKRQALSNAYYRASHLSYWAGQMCDARAYLWGAWQSSPLNFQRTMLLVLLGNPFRWYLLRRGSAPYYLSVYWCGRD